QAYDNYMFQYATPQDGTGSGNVTIFDNVYYKNFVIAANQTASAGFNFTVDRVPATLTGKILSQRGVPVPNIKVFWSNGWEFSVTDSAGNFEINTLQEGLGRVYLYGSGWTALEIEDENDIIWPTLARGTTSELGELKIFANIEPIITGVSFSPSSPAVGQELEITVDATDPDNDTVLYSFEDPLGSAFTTVTDSTIDTLAFEPSTQGWIKVKITADDGQGSESTSIEQWVYIRNNPKPEIRDISGFSTSWKKDAAMNVLVDAFDPLGEHLTYAAILIDSSNALVDALTVGRDDGSIVIDHTQVANGDYTLTITISDGVNEITASLKFRADDNTPPVINYIYKSDATADVANNIGEYVVYKQGSTASLIVDASDNVSVDNIEWKLSPLLTGVAPSTTNITGDTITFDIDEPGFYSAGVIVSDSMSLIDSKPFSIIVQSNLLPEISSAQFNETKVLKVAGGYTDIDGVGLTPNDTLILSVSASDPDGSAQLTFAFDSIVHSGGTIPPSTASVVATQDASTDYELTGLNPGRYAVKYTVTDGDGGAVSGYAQFQVTIDNPPFVTDFYVPFQRTSNKSVDLRAIAQDPEGKALSFTWSISYPAFDTSNEDATFDSIPIDTATDSFISFRTPTLPGDEGYVTINLDVSDGSLSTTLKRTMKIVKDTPPNIGFVSVFPSTVNTGGELYLEANAYDIDGGLTKIEWDMMDASADLSTATTPLLSELNGTPTLDASTDAGNYLVWLLVSDGNTDVSSDTIAITVVQANSPPATPTISTSGVSLVVGETTT
ncbi:cadherin repeat domain-containing protein, partial [bacterium]|nr:cadherin repeat domain-containing protein [bacterium]